MLSKMKEMRSKIEVVRQKGESDFRLRVRPWVSKQQINRLIKVEARERQRPEGRRGGPVIGKY